MNTSHICTSGIQGIRSFVVTIETDIQRGLFSFDIVGLADKTIAESKHRIISALKNSQFNSPKTKHHRIVSLLSPSGLKKEGSHFDLPIAVSYLEACGYVARVTNDTAFFGELSLKGDIQPVLNITNLLHTVKLHGIKEVFVPRENNIDFSLFHDISIYQVSSLRDVVQILNTEDKSVRQIYKVKVDSENNPAISKEGDSVKEYSVDDINGLVHAKRALEIALAGKHHILFYGPPGVGKSMLAKSAVELLPDLSVGELVSLQFLAHDMEGASVNKNSANNKRPPYRYPHHTSSYVQVIGNARKVGEVSLAHNGILFLDEIAEFDRRALESLRQPLEDKKVCMRDTQGDIHMPADFILIASMNPCRCGYTGSQHKKCTCSANSVRLYNDKISGPISDRIDMWVYISEKDSRSVEKYKSGKDMGASIGRVRSTKTKTDEKGTDHVRMSNDAVSILAQSIDKLKLSKRSEKLLIKVAMTIALLDESKEVVTEHILEALSYRKRN